jgi:hypothetical protein
MAYVVAQDIYESLTTVARSQGVCHGTIWEDSGVQLLARVNRADNTPLLQAEITSITGKVFLLDSTTPTTASSTPTVTVASVIFDTLQTDSRWDRIEFEFDPSTAGEENCVMVFELSVQERYAG